MDRISSPLNRVARRGFTVGERFSDFVLYVVNAEQPMEKLIEEVVSDYRR